MAPGYSEVGAAQTLSKTLQKMSYLFMNLQRMKEEENEGRAMMERFWMKVEKNVSAQAPK